MTTHTVFGIAGPFTDVAGDRLEPTTEYQLLDKVTKDPLILPAGNVVIEFSMRRRAPEGETVFDLTPGRGVAFGLDGDARLYTGTPGVITDYLNTFDLNPANEQIPYTHFVRVDPSTNPSKLLRTDTQDRNFVLQSGFGGNIVDGGVSVVIKYKPFSDSVAERNAAVVS